MKLTRAKLTETLRRLADGKTVYQARKVGKVSVRRVYQVKELDEYLLADYKAQAQQKERNYVEYEKNYRRRVQQAITHLEPLIKEAVAALHIHRGRGDEPSLSVERKVRLILVKEMVEKANRPSVVSDNYYTTLSFYASSCLYFLLNA